MKHITITVKSELEDIELYLRDILTTMKYHDEVTDFSVKTSTFTERPVKEHSNNKSISNHEAAEILKLMPKQSDAIKKAIEVLEQEPCEDAVSREAVLDKAYAYGYGLEPEGYCVDVADIQSLPSVTPKSETVTEFADRCRECGREKVLDKIRAEIEKLKPNNPYFKGYFEQNVALNKALEVIDKYKAESEVDNAGNN